MIFAEYRLIRKLGEGTFSEVLKAQSVQTGQYVAIKCMKSHFDSIDQVSQEKTQDLTILLWELIFIVTF